MCAEVQLAGQIHPDAQLPLLVALLHVLVLPALQASQSPAIYMPMSVSPSSVQTQVAKQQSATCTPLCWGQSSRSRRKQGDIAETYRQRRQRKDAGAVGHDDRSMRMPPGHIRSSHIREAEEDTIWCSTCK